MSASAAFASLSKAYIDLDIEALGCFAQLAEMSYTTGPGELRPC